MNNYCVTFMYNGVPYSMSFISSTKLQVAFLDIAEKTVKYCLDVNKVEKKEGVFPVDIELSLDGIAVGSWPNFYTKEETKPITIPSTHDDNGGFHVIIDSITYSKEAITAACYKFTDKYFIHQQTSPLDDKKIEIVFEAKDNNHPISNFVINSFCNELIDQQVRVNVNHEFGHIRDLIVEEAFKPVNK